LLSIDYWRHDTIFKKKDVLCSQCGFFGWRVIDSINERIKLEVSPEIDQLTRDRFQRGECKGFEDDDESGETSVINCYRSQWHHSPYFVVNAWNLLDTDTIRQLKKCHFYIKYQPGFNPSEHKEIKRDQETKRVIMVSSLLGAAIGAAAAIITQLIYRLSS
jgi:hypothetical protein